MNDSAKAKQEELDKRYIRMASIWAENSYCIRRQVGALIVKDQMIISDGYNGTPAGFENICEDENNVTKPYVLHAEANAIISAARRDTVGGTLYLAGRDARTGELLSDATSCAMCRRTIINAGLERVVIRRTNEEFEVVPVQRWIDEDDSLDLLRGECGCGCDG